jgi:hypothetical protein
MNPMLLNVWVVAAVLAQSLLFKFFHLTARKLQEADIAPINILHYQRYAIFPAFFLLLFTFRIEYVEILISDPWLLAGLIVLPVLWGDCAVSQLSLYQRGQFAFVAESCKTDYQSAIPLPDGLAAE